MTIGRIGASEPIQPGREGGRKSRIEKMPGEGDSIAISKDTIRRAEEQRLIDMVREAPGGDPRAEIVRAGKIAEIKQKIDDPHYMNAAVMNAVADDIIMRLAVGTLR